MELAGVPVTADVDLAQPDQRPASL